MTDKYYSLNALALATVEEDPHVRVSFDKFPDVGLDPEEVLAVFRSWLRLQLGARRFLPPGSAYIVDRCLLFWLYIGQTVILT